MIIGVNGYAGSGKDTVGTIIQYLLCPSHNRNESLQDILKEPSYHEWWLEDESEWEIQKWAGKLKVVASILTGIPVEKFEDQEFKKTNLGPEWSFLKMKPGKRQDGIFPKKVDMDIAFMTVRDLLQKLGTDACRDNLHYNTWVNALMSDYKKELSECGTSKKGTVVKCSKYPNWIITDTRFPNEADAIKNAGGIIIRVERPGVKPINDHPSEVGLDHWTFDYVINNDGDLESLSNKVKDILIKEQIM
jgi:hypothetical protein